MAFTGRTLAALRTIALTGMSTRATAASLTLDTAEGSDAWKEADALASMVLAYEGSAEDLAQEIDPRTASETTLDRWMAITAQAAGDGVAGAYTVSVTGRDGTVSIGARVLTRNGLRYTPQSTEVVISGGTGTLSVEAAETGTDYELAVGDTLRWDAAPLGLDPTATVTIETTTAEDGDGADEKRAATLAWLRARPSGGNPAQIKTLAEQHRDCVVAYVYPTLAPHPSGQSSAHTYLASRLDTPGTFTVVALGAEQGDNPVSGGTTHSRSRTLTQANNVLAFLQGDQDADAVDTAGAVGQRFSTQVLPDDAAVATPVINVVNTLITFTPNQANTPGWSGTMTIVSSTTTTVTVSGDQTAKDGEDVLLLVGIAAARGGWVKRTVTNGAFGGVNTVFDVDTLPAVAAGTVYPVLGHWESLRDAFFTWFDSLGPGDVPSAADTAAALGTTRRRRFPPLSWGGKANVSIADVLRLSFSVAGTLNATVVAPAADVAEAPLTLHVLGTLLLRPA